MQSLEMIKALDKEMIENARIKRENQNREMVYFNY